MNKLTPGQIRSYLLCPAWLVLVDACLKSGFERRTATAIHQELGMRVVSGFRALFVKSYVSGSKPPMNGNESKRFDAGAFGWKLRSTAQRQFRSRHADRRPSARNTAIANGAGIDCRCRFVNLGESTNVFFITMGNPMKRIVQASVARPLLKSATTRPRIFW